MLKTSAPAQYILILIDMVEQLGYSRELLLSGTSLAHSGIQGIGARVSEDDFTRLVSKAFELTGNKALGLHLGQRLNLSAHAVLGQAFMTCDNLEQVMELLLKYYHLLSPTLQLEFEIKQQQCLLTTVTRPQDNPIYFSYELMYAAMLNTLRGLLNLPELKVRVELPYPAPEHASEYFKVFGQDVHFDCLRGRFIFPQSLLDTALPSSNPALRKLYEQECARLLADLEEEDSVAERTLRLLRKLEGQYPQMPTIAQMLNYSPRTYRRRLEQENYSYQQLLDQVRAEHATHYLKNTRLPLSTIAYLVGFSDASNFRRAYQKWSGQTPRAVRKGE
ncbi:AraC family transcriptional regulator [Parahaliea sp. F7430]|uniref:AraC family transcriptional regulator n=1 Tax=Sediminihaliea albiluteola TaxID=2758564 RepID=A0A7W2TWI4_9GAMM|nr:AraC family transcriptional regulator [Sediminihaliea albiluteola]MBA6413250.1 AraC family transcriptional regulator [Sediminihaliea albiluteola]